MSVNDIITNALVGKRLVLYSITWIDHTSKVRGKVIDLHKTVHMTSGDVGIYEFDQIKFDPPNKWSKKKLESMVITKMDYLITDVEILDHEEWYKTSNVGFTLEGFGAFECNIYDDLTIID